MLPAFGFLGACALSSCHISVPFPKPLSGLGTVPFAFRGSYLP